MDGDVNGAQEQTGGAAAEAESARGGASGAQAEVGGAGVAGGGSAAGGGAGALDYESAIAERDARIDELQAQVAEAMRNADAAEALAAQIEQLRAEGEAQKVDFALQLAGVRNVKAARAVLDEHGGDVDALRAAEPWLFVDGQARGATGLPSAGDTVHRRRAVRARISTDTHPRNSTP